MAIWTVFQYRKRYVRVATACLETRPQTGLKRQIGKPLRFFPVFCRHFPQTQLPNHALIRFYASIHADSRAYEKSGKPLFQLSFIIAGFHTICQIAKRFSKIVFFTFSSYTGICFLKNASYFWFPMLMTIRFSRTRVRAV